MIRTYSELIRLPSYDERLNYLRLDGKVGSETFGWERIFNQKFYTSDEWKSIRNAIIVRDQGCDLACLDREILEEPIFIHHLNAITLQDLQEGNECLLDPENLISTTFGTHQIIHYGTRRPIVPRVVIERAPNDTCPWKHI